MATRKTYIGPTTDGHTPRVNGEGLTWIEWLHAAGKNYYQHTWWQAWLAGEDPTDYREWVRQADRG